MSTRDFPPPGRRSAYGAPDRGYDGPRRGRSRYDGPGRPGYDQPRFPSKTGTAERYGYGPPRGWAGGGGRRARPSGLGSGGRRSGPRGRWTWKRLAAYGAIACGIGIVIISVVVGYTYAKTPIPTAASQAALSQQSSVYFSDGKSQVGTFGDVNRRILQPNEIPPAMQEAAISAEDRNFYHEGGVSPTGIARAVYEDLTGGGIAQGGSTITQQFVRNYYSNIGTQQTFTRKFKEIFVATKVARRMSKNWILTQYLNTINLGRAYGVGAASQAYFGKPLSSLNVAQTAELAAIIQLPNYYSTPAGSSALQVRWNYVLDGMEKMGFLNPAQRPTKMPKFIPEQANNNSWNGYRGYIMEAVDYELKHTYGYTESQIENGGLHISTTFNKGMEDAAYASVNQNEEAMKASGKKMPPYAHVGMTVIQPSGPDAGGVVATYGGKNWAEPPKQCAADHCQEDMALAARNQVGSSFKPYVLATAVRQGISIRSILDGRSPLCIPPDSMPNTQAKVMDSSSCKAQHPGWYPVSNDQGDIKVSKVSDMTSAMAYSLNTAYVDLTHQIGTIPVAKTAESLGVDPNSLNTYAQNHYTGIAIGIASLSTEEQASTMATFANGGTYVTPHVISKLSDSSGNNIPVKVTHTRVFTPQQAGAIDYALSKDTIYGTAKDNGPMADGRPIIAKTGTTENAQAAFFLGAIPQYASAVGMFTDDQSGKTKQTLNGIGGLPGYGGLWPTKIWHSFAESEFASLPIENFLPPYFGGRMLQQAQLPPPPKPTAPSPLPTPKAKPSCDPAAGPCGGKHKSSPPPCLPGDPNCSSPAPPPTSPPPTLPLPGGGGGGNGGAPGGPGAGGSPGTGGQAAAADARRTGGG